MVQHVSLQQFSHGELRRRNRIMRSYASSMRWMLPLPLVRTLT